METGSEANTTMVSDLNSGNKMPAIKDTASSRRESPGTAGYQEAARVQASLRSCKNRLTKVHEDLKQNLLLAQKRAAIDPSWVEKVTDLQLKSEVAEKGVELARVLSLQLDPKSECEDGQVAGSFARHTDSRGGRQSGSETVPEGVLLSRRGLSEAILCFGSIRHRFMLVKCFLAHELLRCRRPRAWTLPCRKRAATREPILQA